MKRYIAMVLAAVVFVSSIPIQPFMINAKADPQQEETTEPAAGVYTGDTSSNEEIDKIKNSYDEASSGKLILTSNPSFVDVTDMNGKTFKSTLSSSLGSEPFKVTPFYIPIKQDGVTDVKSWVESIGLSIDVTKRGEISYGSFSTNASNSSSIIGYIITTLTGDSISETVVYGVATNYNKNAAFTVCKVDGTTYNVSSATNDNIQKVIKDNANSKYFKVSNLSQGTSGLGIKNAEGVTTKEILNSSNTIWYSVGTSEPRMHEASTNSTNNFLTLVQLSVSKDINLSERFDTSTGGSSANLEGKATDALNVKFLKYGGKKDTPWTKAFGTAIEPYWDFPLKGESIIYYLPWLEGLIGESNVAALGKAVKSMKGQTQEEFKAENIEAMNFKDGAIGANLESISEYIKKNTGNKNQIAMTFIKYMFFVSKGDSGENNDWVVINKLTGKEGETDWTLKKFMKEMTGKDTTFTAEEKTNLCAYAHALWRVADLPMPEDASTNYTTYGIPKNAKFNTVFECIIPEKGKGGASKLNDNITPTKDPDAIKSSGFSFSKKSFTEAQDMVNLNLLKQVLDINEVDPFDGSTNTFNDKNALRVGYYAIAKALLAGTDIMSSVEEVSEDSTDKKTSYSSYIQYSKALIEALTQPKGLTNLNFVLAAAVPCSPPMVTQLVEYDETRGKTAGASADYGKYYNSVYLNMQDSVFAILNVINDYMSSGNCLLVKPYKEKGKDEEFNVPPVEVSEQLDQLVTFLKKDFVTDEYLKTWNFKEKTDECPGFDADFINEVYAYVRIRDLLGIKNWIGCLDNKLDEDVSKKILSFINSLMFKLNLNTDESDPNILADILDPTQATPEAMRDSLTDQYKLGVGISASFIPLQTNLYDINTWYPDQFQDWLKNFHMKYGFHRKALYIDKNHSSASLYYLKGKRSGTKLCTLKDLLEPEKDIMLYIDKNVYNADDVAKMMQITPGSGNIEVEKSKVDPTKYAEDMIEGVADFFSLDDKGAFLKTGGSARYSKRVKSTIDYLFGNSFKERFLAALKGGALLSRMETVMRAIPAPAQAKMDFQNRDYSAEQTRGLIAAVYYNTGLFNVANQVSVKADPVFISSPNLSAIEGVKGIYKNSIFNYILLKNISEGMTSDLKITLDMDSPVFMDVYGNIITQNGLVVVPVAANATLLSESGYNPFTSAFMSTYGKSYKLPVKYTNSGAVLVDPDAGTEDEGDLSIEDNDIDNNQPSLNSGSNNVTGVNTSADSFELPLHSAVTDTKHSATREKAIDYMLKDPAPLFNKKAKDNGKSAVHNIDSKQIDMLCKGLTKENKAAVKTFILDYNKQVKMWSNSNATDKKDVYNNRLVPRVNELRSKLVVVNTSEIKRDFWSALSKPIVVTAKADNIQNQVKEDDSKKEEERLKKYNDAKKKYDDLKEKYDIEVACCRTMRDFRTEYQEKQKKKDEKSKRFVKENKKKYKGSGAYIREHREKRNKLEKQVAKAKKEMDKYSLGSGVVVPMGQGNNTTGDPMSQGTTDVLEDEDSIDEEELVDNELAITDLTKETDYTYAIVDGFMTKKDYTGFSWFVPNKANDKWELSTIYLDGVPINTDNFPAGDSYVGIAIINIFMRNCLLDDVKINSNIINVIMEALRGAPIENIDFEKEHLATRAKISTSEAIVAKGLDNISDGLTQGNMKASPISIPNPMFAKGFEYIFLPVVKLLVLGVFISLFINLFREGLQGNFILKPLFKFLKSVALTIAAFIIFPLVIYQSYYAANKWLLDDQMKFMAMMNEDKRREGKEVGVNTVKEPSTSTKIWIKLEELDIPWYLSMKDIMFGDLEQTADSIYEKAFSKAQYINDTDVVRKANSVYVDLTSVLDATTIYYTKDGSEFVNSTDKKNVFSYVSPYYYILDSLIGQINQYQNDMGLKTGITSIDGKGKVVVRSGCNGFLLSPAVFPKEGESPYDLTGLFDAYGVNGKVVNDNYGIKEDIQNTLWFNPGVFEDEVLARKLTAVENAGQRFIAKNNKLLGKISDETFLKFLALNMAMEYNKQFDIPVGRSLELIDVDLRDIYRLSTLTPEKIYRLNMYSLGLQQLNANNGLSCFFGIFAVLTLWLSSYMKLFLIMLIIVLSIVSLVFRKIILQKESRAIEGFMVSMGLIAALNFAYALMVKLCTSLPSLIHNGMLCTLMMIIVQILYLIALLRITIIQLKDWRDIGFNEISMVANNIANAVSSKFGKNRNGQPELVGAGVGTAGQAVMYGDGYFTKRRKKRRGTPGFDEENDTGLEGKAATMSGDEIMQYLRNRDRK